jgi:hypothetical protein
MKKSPLIPQDSSIFNPLEIYIHKSSTNLYKYSSFYPSDASCVVNGEVVGTCLRRQYWRWIGVPATEGSTYRSYLSARLGYACEETFLDIYQRMGLLKGRALRHKATIMGMNISFKTDGETKKGELVECKSAYGTAFYNSVNKSPKLDHLCQIMMYMAILGIDICIIPYICRDNAAKRAVYRISKKQIESLGITAIGILGRWKKLQKCLNDKMLPDCDFEPKSWQCGYCVYKSMCKGRMSTKK